jgi:D-glycero-D-manno-heptose 1,7-bisphosphate phosphatase
MTKGDGAQPVPQEIGRRTKRLTARDYPGRPCLFLDRDGVVVDEVGYLHRVEDIRLVGGVAEAIGRANEAGVPVVLVTNQGGIGRGYYGWADYEAVQEALVDRLEAQGAAIDLALACAYHAAGQAPYSVADDLWRKPRPGMFLEAGVLLGVDLPSSYVVGDTLSDLVAARAAGLTQGALTLTGHGRRDFREHWPTIDGWRLDGTFDCRVVDEPAEAISDWLNKLAGNGLTG